jgi:hypothetical protein
MIPSPGGGGTPACVGLGTAHIPPYKYCPFVNEKELVVSTI